MSRRPWDSYAAYLFDIDGTLLHCTDAVHYFAFCNALSSIAGRPLNLDGVVAHGNTDMGILRDAFTLAGIPELRWRPRMAEARGAMCDEVDSNKANLYAVALPYVEEVLHHLHACGALLGVATGNFAGIGRLKLGHCGLLHHFEVEGFSDGFEERADVFAAALQKVQTRVGQDAAVCVVGDTPADVQAARSNGLDVIAVATGVYSQEQLLLEQPTFCVSSLSELLGSA